MEHLSPNEQPANLHNKNDDRHDISQTKIANLTYPNIISYKYRT